MINIWIPIVLICITLFVEIVLPFPPPPLPLLTDIMRALINIICLTLPWDITRRDMAFKMALLPVTAILFLPARTIGILPLTGFLLPAPWLPVAIQRWMQGGLPCQRVGPRPQCDPLHQGLPL